jgi:hypothetical protein
MADRLPCRRTAADRGGRVINNDHAYRPPAIPSPFSLILLFAHTLGPVPCLGTEFTWCPFDCVSIVPSKPVIFQSHKREPVTTAGYKWQNPRANHGQRIPRSLHTIKKKSVMNHRATGGSALFWVQPGGKWALFSSRTPPRA